MKRGKPENSETVDNVAGFKKSDHYIVAIGASAGGLEAINSLFEHTKELISVSYIVIQHLSPDHKSLLVELVSKHTNMHVFEAKHQMRVEPNCIYIIPPKKIMTIEGGILQLAEKVANDKKPNTAIDSFLYSLAADMGEKAIAVILSGTGTDGTKGIEAIKDAGGFIIVQDPESAKFDGMPRSAISSGYSDYIASAERIPDEINTIVKEAPLNIFYKGKLDEKLLEEIFKLIFKQTGCDFRNYKYPTLVRRIARRMQHLGYKLINDYIENLQESTDEVTLLCQDFLIGVTCFFRDNEAYEVLDNKVFPAIIKGKTADDHIKIWVTACSTGEEAYSIAILFDQFLKRTNTSLSVKIFATDIDAHAIDTASKGEYSLNIAKDIPENILNTYFFKRSKSYVIIPEIRKQIVFARQNIIKDPPFIKNDLVSCRNMLIYMDNVLQAKILSNLNFSLNADGFLFLGSSETLTSVKDNFEEVDRKWKIYHKTGKASRKFPFTTEADVDYTSHRLGNPVKIASKDNIHRTLTEELRETIIEEYKYTALYIDKNYEIKEAVGDFRQYLSLPEHTLNLNILRMTPPDLAALLGNAIRQSWKTNKKVALKKITIRDKQLLRLVNITIKPALGNSGLTLIVLNELESATNELKPELSLPHTGAATEDYIEELKAELTETKHNLQAAIEELETANEELQSSNEELLSSNEELQSSNEELQSLNEELHTLNTEHQLKIHELIELNDDLNNYFRSTDIGQIFLDRTLKIRKFNPAAVRLVNLIESDIGRPLSNISTNIQDETLFDDIELVMRHNNVIEKEVKLRNNNATLMRIYPYVRLDKQTDGIVITFVDISAIKDLNNIITGIFNASRNAIMALKAVRDHNDRIVDFQWLEVNEAAEKMYSKSKEELLASSLRKLYPSTVEKGLFGKYIDVVHKDIVQTFEYPFRCNDKTGWWEVTAAKMLDGVAVTFTDITDKKESDERLKANYNELINTKEELKNLNAGLEDRITERTKKLSDSEERFRLVSQVTNDTIMDWDLVNNTMWLSDNFYKMFGHKKPETVLNRKYWLEKVHPDDKKAISDSINKAINTNKKQWSAEYRFLRADGTYAQVLDRGYILHDEYNTPYRMLSSMLDVTNLREAQNEAISNLEQRQFLAESMPLIVWTATPSGKINFLNTQYSVYTGKDVKNGLGQGWEKIINPEQLPLLRQEWKNAIRRRDDFAVEAQLKKSDGKYYWHLIRARAKKDDSGRIAMWVGTTIDIHAQRMATEIMEHTVAQRTLELKIINEQLEASNHDLQQFASVTSHDLKEPLRKIHMFSNMLKDKYLSNNEGASEYMDRIIASSSRMTRLINDLLNFSRLSVKALFAKVNLNIIIDEILSDLELVIQEKNAVINVDDFPVIEAIPGQMRQLFQNLISNALKFSKKDIRPFINIRGTVKENNRIQIVVEDNGIGFNEKYLDKIFTIFQRLHTREEYEGTGIGLAICKKIVDKHNGTITAHSREDAGSRFIITLPVNQEVIE